MRNTRLTYKRRETQVNREGKKPMGGKRYEQTVENRNVMEGEMGCVIAGDKRDGTMVGLRWQGSNPFMHRPRLFLNLLKVYTGFGISNEIYYI